MSWTNILKFLYVEHSTGNLVEEEAEGVGDTERTEDTKRMSPLKQLNKACLSSKRLKQQAQGPFGSLPGQVHIYYSFQVSIFMGFPNV